MSSPRTILLRGVTLGLFAAVMVAGAFLAYVVWYTQTDRLLPGVRIGQIDVGGLARWEASQRLSNGVPWRPPVLAGGPGAAGGEPVQGSGVTGSGNLIGPTGIAGTGPSRRPDPIPPAIQLQALGRTWLLDRAEVGPVPDVQAAVREALEIGRQGSALQRARAFVSGWIHGYEVPVQIQLGEGAIRDRLAEIAREIAKPPGDAAYDVATDTLIPDVTGQELDLATSVEVVRKAVLLERPTVDLVVRSVTASVRAQDLTSARRYQIARFTTPILAADPGRVHNISKAVSKISGAMLKPGQIFSFNEIVGPRDAKRGWAPAKEIYQGEFVLGYGGGICQVSSTLYNSVLLAGLEVKERYHHDRPLEYVRPGRDATVAWDVLDFRFRNSMDVPILLGAKVLPGQPQHIEVTLHAPRPLRGGPIGLEEADVKYLPPELVEILDDKLAEGERKVSDEGHYGLDIKIYRVFGEGAQRRRELVSHDRYQPKPGKVLVGVGNAPGSQKLLEPGLQ